LTTYKAVRHNVRGVDRFFVIPHDADVFELVDPNATTIPDAVIAQGSTWDNAVRVAIALNRYAMQSSTVAPSSAATGDAEMPFTARAAALMQEAAGGQENWSKYEHAILDLAREADDRLNALPQEARKP